MKGILFGRGGVEHCACCRRGRHSDAARTEQESAGEVAAAGFRAGAERAECGGVLPGAPLVRAALLLVEERLRETAPAKPAGVGRFVEVNVAAEPEPSTPTDARVEIRLHNGRSLAVGPGFDAGHLQALLAVVEAAAPAASSMPA